MKKKKIIAIVLAAALVAAGLGGFAYANAGTVNEVSAMFSTQWYYDVPGDTFLNKEVEGHEDFFAQMQNDPDDTGDDTGADVIGLTLTLATETEFNFFQEENLVSEEYPPYEWDFDNVPEGLGPVAWVGFRGPTQPLVSLTPGFDASRSLSETKFSAPGTQTLTITLTPRQAQVVSEGWFSIGVGAEENELVNPVITSPTGGEGIQLRSEGHRLDIHPTGLHIDDEWSITVTIDVTPKVPKVEFMPFVDIKWFGPPSDSGSTTESWLSYTVSDEVGTWTWSAKPWNDEGSYEWQWAYHMARKLQWHPCSRDLSNHVWAHFNTAGRYHVPGDNFTNGDKGVTGDKSWWATLYNPEDETEAAPITGLNLSLKTELAFDYAGVMNGELVSPDPPPYEWSFADVAEGLPWPHVPHAYVGFSPSSPNSIPVTFTPGFNASRSLSETEFFQSEGTQTQTLTITLTPLDQQVVETLHINVVIPLWTEQQKEFVDAVIKPPTGVENFALTPDQQRLWIWPTDLTVGTPWTTTVTIEVMPKVPQIAFIPYVLIPWKEFVNYGTESGKSLSRPMDEVGTWTWSAEGSYIWDWGEEVERAVDFYGCCQLPSILPVAQASVDPYLAPVRSDFTFDGSASYDPDGEIVAYDWDFGDGTSDSGVSVPHTYTAPGLYDVLLTVTDNMCAKSTDSVMAVVYDPDAGFVTGGGWIYSDAGADRMNPSAEGKATFGFVSKYKRGATEPTGQTEFRFKAGDLNFHSTEYAWLVVNQAGTNAQFKGTGTINGTGEYKFMLWAGDDDPDTFRIRIWEEDEYGNEVERYDNGFDQTIAGGSIVIHAKK